MGIFINFYRRRTITTHRDVITPWGHICREFTIKSSRKLYLSRPRLRRVLDPNQIILVDDVEVGTNMPIRYYEVTKDSLGEYRSALIYLADMPQLVHTAFQDTALRQIPSATVEPRPRTASGFSPHQPTEPKHELQSQSQHPLPAEATQTSLDALATMPQSQLQLEREMNEQDISCRIPNPAPRRPLIFRHYKPCPNKPITRPCSKIIDSQPVTKEQELDEGEPFDTEARLAKEFLLEDEQSH